MSLRRIPINLRLPPALWKRLQRHCDNAELAYTAFIEAAIREKMERENIRPEYKHPTWDGTGDIEDMPGV